MNIRDQHEYSIGNGLTVNDEIPEKDDKEKNGTRKQVTSSIHLEIYDPAEWTKQATR